MGGTCSCFQTPSQSVHKSTEFVNYESSLTFSNNERAVTETDSQEFASLITRLAKRMQTLKYLKILQTPDRFQLPYQSCSVDISTIQASIITQNEEEYGFYRTLPAFTGFFITQPLIETEDFLYEGQWDVFSKRPHGSGVSYSLTDHEKYSGHFSHGARHGLGRLMLANGDLYEGEFYNNQIAGTGTYIHFQGKVYIGEFKFGQKEGYGKEQDRHESCYEGFFHKNEKSGQGKMIWADGKMYEGSFVKGQFHGIGEFYVPGEKKCCGQWIGNKMHGEGRCVWEDGREYTGQFFQDYPHGKGTMKFSDGTSFTGMFKKGERV